MTKKNKKGAMELSMSTIIILVLAMSMLILGLVLVRSIFDNEERFGKDACENLAYTDEQGYGVIYKPLNELVDAVEKKFNMSVDSYGTIGEWRGCSGNNGCQNIDCRLPITLCSPSRYESGYCINLDLNLVINYEEWKEWRDLISLQ